MSSQAHPLAPADRDAFAALAEQHRHELQVHCYRMLASFDDAQDLVQETFLRAWRKRATYAGRSSFRAWLYGIATNACLDAIARRARTLAAVPDFEVTWLEPYPDALLDAVDAPDDAVIAKETVELAYLVAIQHMTPQSRAVLILRDVVGLPASETAELLETTVAAVNSALQRARAVLAEHLPRERGEWAGGAGAAAEEKALLERYVAATEALDVDGLKATLAEEVRFAMPPDHGRLTGRDTVVDAWVSGGLGTGEFSALRCVVTYANRQPAVANYVVRDGEWRPFALDVLRIAGGEIAEIVAFPLEDPARFGLPEVLA
ncbi:MAG TPA: RNA polymerase subunit sigma-70 [Solirubrobacteraceae bacterium]|jgi:RNA polymerase sigma-70 factor (ECF subfamily)|nr:RNA polymerase subunit sigma-70 [Solirubrobacteraceae bacterium]